MTRTYRLHYAPDNASLIIRLALEELGVPFDTLLVDRSAKAQRSPEYLALNPAGRIPTLETPEGPISETAAILLWLSERHGALTPAPGTPDRAPFLNWLLFVANTLHPDAIQMFYIHRYGPEAAWPEMREKMQGRIARHLATLEQLAATLPGFCEETPSALDLYVAAILRWLALYPSVSRGWFTLTDYPTLQDMCARLETRPSVASLIAAEGMSARPFTAPQPPDPPEGSAL